MPEAARHNQGKVPLSQLFHMLPGMIALARHMEAGRAKYPDQPDGTPNWKLGGKPDTEYLDAAARHLAALVEGQWFDDETGTPHAAAVMWNMGALITCNHPDQLLAVAPSDTPLGVLGLPSEPEKAPPSSFREGDTFYWVSGPNVTFDPETPRTVDMVSSRGVVYRHNAYGTHPEARGYARFEDLSRHAVLAGPPVDGKAPYAVQMLRELRAYPRTGSASA